MLSILAPCIIALGIISAEHGDRMPMRAVACADVTYEAMRAGVDVQLAVSVAYHESRIDYRAQSSQGAVGPMQVVPRWWCPDGKADGCDLVRAGVGALASYTTRYGVRDGLARYNAGNSPGPRARAYASKVMRGVR